MRNMVMLVVLSLVLVIFNVSEVMAHPGRTDSNGGHTCRTNCEKWGYEYGEYHYHNGGSNDGGGSSSSSNSGSSSSTSQPSAPAKPAYTQSDVNEGSEVGKKQGYQDGYDGIDAVAETTSGNEGYQIGYEQGYLDGFKAG